MRILIAYDGSETSRKALLKGKELAEKLSCNVTILYVINDFLTRIYDYTLVFKVDKFARKKQGERILTKGLEYFKDFKKSVNTIIKTGDPATIIVETAKQEKVDMIILGSKGLSGIQKLFIGSVSNKVLIHTDISVLIVK
ncbi:universal stress protein [Crassaminicella thermophila]|uniref:Universal stress protein n=1 Tax=Crassaminicella thermophila TaxID=2599308 RepID=A0A5C0SGS9_CRATE|nr:universal stress protein [Crassaminicella thermophila]QEK12169.1 universal stress protein [Crassaminicella thermophila]